MTSVKFTRTPENLVQEVCREVEQEYDFVLGDFVQHVYNGEEARNSAVATILIQVEKQMKGISGLAEKYQKALAKEGLDAKLMDTWRFFTESKVKSVGYEIRENDSAKINGYIAHVISSETDNSAIERKILDYVYRNLDIKEEDREGVLKAFGLE